VLEAEKVGKIRDRYYMDLGYSRFFKYGYMKTGGCPNQGRHGLLHQVKEGHQG
jgi:hypothetical protein